MIPCFVEWQRVNLLVINGREKSDYRNLDNLLKILLSFLVKMMRLGDDAKIMLCFPSHLCLMVVGQSFDRRW